MPETTLEARIVGPIPSQSNFTGTITASSGTAVAAPNNVVQVTANNPFTGTNTSSLRSLFLASLYSRRSAEVELWPSQRAAAQRSSDLTDDLADRDLVRHLRVATRVDDGEGCAEAVRPGIGDPDATPTQLRAAGRPGASCTPPKLACPGERARPGPTKSSTT